MAYFILTLIKKSFGSKQQYNIITHYDHERKLIKRRSLFIKEMNGIYDK